MTSAKMIESYSDGSSPFGITYGAWTVEWWRWATSFPPAVNPVNDQTGRFANASQPHNVFFLAGKFGSESNEFPKRHCNIPNGNSILFPIINCQANLLEDPDLGTEDVLRDHVTKDIDTIIRNDCFINDNGITSVRVASDPMVFSIKILKEFKGGKQLISTLAAADGYWVFLKPLPIGDYKITFRGSCEKGRLSSGADYTIKIT